jgi:hypothetical protein
VWATRSALDATAAKVAMVSANAPHQGLSDLEEAWIVRSLCRDHRLTQAEVGKALRRDKSWVCRRLALAERVEPALQEVRRALHRGHRAASRQSASAARRRAKSPSAGSPWKGWCLARASKRARVRCTGTLPASW